MTYRVVTSNNSNIEVEVNVPKDAPAGESRRLLSETLAGLPLPDDPGPELIIVMKKKEPAEAEASFEAGSSGGGITG